MNNCKCLICEKELSIEGFMLLDAGYLEINFHYGSRYDRLKMNGDSVSNWTKEEDPLLASDEIEAYICDDCFDKKRHLMKGFDIKNSRPIREQTI